ncbi:MAG: YccF domain-containing protein [Candidatus Marinimicrobia bacterium]|nr:YccF domain-containing protein [Candidatus Neomarinimicrobiota bacterium]
MSLLGNLLWIVLGGGIFIFLEYLIGGLLLCITIIGIPFGLQCIKLSVLGLFPFGKRVERTSRSSGFISIIMNILWILVGGIWVSITHLIFAVLTGITIIGLPFAKQHIKLASMALAPFATQIR